MHPSLHLIALVVLAVALGISCGLAMVQVALRSWSLPACWSCGTREVRPSARQRSLSDLAARLFLLSPYRCRGCQRRFYVIRVHRALAEPHS